MVPRGAPRICSPECRSEQAASPKSRRELFSRSKACVLHLADQEIDQVSSELSLSPEFLSAGIGALSGGQFQKVLIAFALLGRPNVLLFDEPTASLDELTEERIYELVHQLQGEGGITLILVSHAPERCVSLCEPGFVFEQGQGLHGSTQGNHDA